MSVKPLQKQRLSLTICEDGPIVRYWLVHLDPQSLLLAHEIPVAETEEQIYASEETTSSGSFDHRWQKRHTGIELGLHRVVQSCQDSFVGQKCGVCAMADISRLFEFG